jgi:matrix metalloproteinase-25 (membrane-inserted)
MPHSDRKHHCKAFASGNYADFTEKPVPLIEEWPHNWNKGEISYRINTHTDDTTRRGQERAVTVALRIWQLRIKDLKFKREYNIDTDVDFNVSFKPLENFSSPGVLAHAWFPGQGPISGDVEINDEWNWVTHSLIGDMGRPPLVPVMTHEFGHSLGLRHNIIDKTSIMYPSFNLGQKKNKLNDNDVERIQARYGARTISQRLIDYFRRRRDLGLDFR